MVRLWDDVQERNAQEQTSRKIVKRIHYSLVGEGLGVEVRQHCEYEHLEPKRKAGGHFDEHPIKFPRF